MLRHANFALGVRLALTNGLSRRLTRHRRLQHPIVIDLDGRALLILHFDARDRRSRSGRRNLEDQPRFILVKSPCPTLPDSENRTPKLETLGIRREFL